MTLDEPFPLLLAVVVGTLAAARVVRLVVDDDWPPVAKLREWYVTKATEQWQPLIECPWCVGVYVAGPAVVWFASLVAWPDATANLYAWWIVNGWLAVAWAAAYLCLRDVPPDQRQ